MPATPSPTAAPRSCTMALEQALVPAPSPQGAQQSWTAAIQSLDELLHARAEVFASPSTSYATGDGKQIHQETLKATKRLFDACKTLSRR